MWAWPCTTLALLLTFELLAAEASPAPKLRGSKGRDEDADAPHSGSGCVQGFYNPWGFQLAGRNLSVKPGHDFFLHANGDYLAGLQIPPSKVVWGVSEVLEARVLEQVREQLEKAAAEGRKVGRFYASYLNRAKVDELGTAPLQPHLLLISKINGSSAFAAVTGRANFGFLPSAFDLSIEKDARNPKVNSLTITQGSLGMSSRNFYLDAKHSKIKQAYGKYISQLLKMVGWPDASSASAKVLALESRLAEVLVPLADASDPEANYNPVSGVADLEAIAPGFDWRSFLEHAAVPSDAKLVIGTKSSVVGIARILSQTSSSVLQSWAAAGLLMRAESELPRGFADAGFAFQQVVSGVKETKPEWQKAIEGVSAYMSDAVGVEYATKYFPPSSKAMVEELVDELRAAFAARIERLPWMGNSTKEKAKKKLREMGAFIGYPSTISNYTSLAIHDTDLFGNVERARTLQWARQLAKLRQPADSGTWDMGAHEVNAYYDEAVNAIFFPAAFLQPPFFDPNAHPAINYGAVGATIGHEMTHGFDGIGSRYDGAGKMHDWWTHADRKEFETRVKHYQEQCTDYRLGVPRGARINGKLTSDENIADLGGIEIALDAYQNFRQHQRADASAQGQGGACVQKALDDEREELRRFFLGYAQSWREKRREKALLDYLLTNVHAPAFARVNMPLRNVDRWYSAFNVAQGSGLYLAEADRIGIW